VKVRFRYLALVLASLSAHAGEGMFNRAYTTETVPQGRFEVEQMIRNRSGRSYGSYSAFDFKTEFEYGVTDQFQAAFYFNTNYMNAKDAPDDDDPGIAAGNPGFSRNLWSVQSLSLEFTYRLLSPISDPIGLAVYMEPTYMLHDLHDGLTYDKAFENEFRIIVQKNFFDDQLILVYNMVAEFEFLRFEGQQDYKGELDWNHEIGATYRAASNLYVGFEARNHNEIGNFITHEHSLIWAGPSIHYANQNFWVTLGLMKQIWGAPNGTDANGNYIGDSLFLRSHENYEATLKFAVPF
jgi:hypothetical protein